MKNFTRTFGVLALVVAMVLAVGCVTGTSASGTGGVAEPHGLFSGGSAQAAVAEGRTEIASYMVILNLFDSGFAEYAAAIKDAEDAGQNITVVTTFIFVGMKYTAYASLGSRPVGAPSSASAQSGTVSSPAASSGAAAAKAAPASAAKKAPVDPVVTFAGNGHKYEVINKPKGWKAAREDCEKRGGYLATVTSDDERQFIEDLIKTHGKKKHAYWVGGSRAGRNWQWVTGESIENIDWVDVKAENYMGASNKLATYETEYGWWGDNAKEYYICEWGDVTVATPSP